MKKTQQRFQNVTNSPLLTVDVDRTVLRLLSVPELHLLLGKEILFNSLMINMNSNRLVNVIIFFKYVPYLKFSTRDC